jgi:hypothetical protein
LDGTGIQVGVTICECVKEDGTLAVLSGPRSIRVYDVVIAPAWAFEIIASRSRIADSRPMRLGKWNDRTTVGPPWPGWRSERCVNGSSP